MAPQTDSAATGSTTMMTGTSTTTPTPSQSTNQSNGPGMNNSAQYLYGFAITFLALFLAFAACAFSSRRTRRRRLRALEQADWNDSDPIASTPRKWTRPTYGEAWLDGTAECKWDIIKPLALKTLSYHDTPSEPLSKVPPPSVQSATDSTGDQTNNLNPVLTPTASRHNNDSPFVYIAPSLMQPFFHRRSKRPPPSDPPPVDDSPPIRAMQVSILVRMPSSDDSKDHESGEKGLGDIALAVASIPWENMALD